MNLRSDPDPDKSGFAGAPGGGEDQGEPRRVWGLGVWGSGSRRLGIRLV